jgi:hypothetical protein
VPLEAVKPWLLEENRAGRACQRGDWFLAGADTRLAAIEIAGEPLRIRFIPSICLSCR